MVAAVLTIALVDPALQKMAGPGVVFRPIAGSGVFTETGVIYRRADPSSALAAFLHELMVTPRQGPASTAASPTLKRESPGSARDQRRKKTATLTARP
jgi:hypothetical protein